MSKRLVVTIKILSFLTFLLGSIAIFCFTRDFYSLLKEDITNQRYYIYIFKAGIVFSVLSLSSIFYQIIEEVTENRYNIKKRCKKILINTSLIYVVTLSLLVIFSITQMEYVIENLEALKMLKINMYELFILAILLEGTNGLIHIHVLNQKITPICVLNPKSWTE